MSYLKRLEYAERNIIFCVASTSANLAWRDQVFSFFPVRKGARKNTKQKNKLDFIDPQHVSRRENVFTLNFTAWKFTPVNNHGVEVFADLSQHDEFHAKSEKFSHGVNERGIWNSCRENSNLHTVTVKKIHCF